ncbi:MAG TPA: DUF4397 domain-containing protein [Trebonia sp.]|jgi:hypothetical protein
MKIMTTTRRLARNTAARLAAAVTLAVTVLALAMPAASAQTTADGWVRLAHLSPNTPAMDVYLYPLEGSVAKPILRHVSYGSVSQFQSVTAGVYALDMLPAGAATGTTPLVSGSVKVVAGDAYTVAALGSASALRLSTFVDPRTTPAGSALVQVIQASVQQKTVSVRAGSTQLAANLAFGKATSFVAAPAGTWSVRAAGQTQRASQQVSLVADTVHTLVVLDGQRGLAIDDLTNAAGSTVMPKAGVQTGFGGAAARPGAPLLPWVVTGLTGLALVATGSVLASRRQRHAQ